VIDGSTTIMPDTQANQKEYPQIPSQKPGLGFPIARLVVIFCLATGSALELAQGQYQGKKTGEDAFFDIALLKQLGVDSVSRLHQRRPCDFRRGRRLGVADGRYRSPLRPVGGIAAPTGWLGTILLSSIASDAVGNRPDRVEPRARKRRPKQYPLLTKPQRQAKAAKTGVLADLYPIEGDREHQLEAPARDAASHLQRGADPHWRVELVLEATHATAVGRCVPSFLVEISEEALLATPL